MSFLPCILLEFFSSADVLDIGTSSFNLLRLRFWLPIALRCRWQLIERATGYGRHSPSAHPSCCPGGDLKCLSYR